MLDRIKEFNLRKVLNLTLLVTVAVSMTTAFRYRYFEQTGDAASFFDFFAKITEGGFLRSDFTLSTHSLYYYMYSVSADDICTTAWTPLHDGQSNFHWHAYLIVLLSPLLQLLPIDSLFVVLMTVSISYISGLIVVYGYLRRNKITFPKTLLFLFLVASWPVLQEGLLGQPYIDRLLFGPAIALVVSIADFSLSRKSKQYLFFVSFILCVAVSERASLIAGLIACLLVVYFRKMNSTSFNNLGFLFGFLGVAWYVIWNILFSKSDYYSNNASLKQIILNFKEIFGGIRSEGAISFAIYLLPLLIIIATLQLKLITISLIAVAPNLFVSIGGAEFTGLHTHYHAMYIPFLVAFAAVALAKGESGALKHNRSIPILIFSTFLSFVTYGGQTYWQNAELNVIRLTKILGVQQMLSGQFDVSVKNPKSQVISSVFKNKAQSSVSAPEVFWPHLLYRDIAKVHYFPVGVGIDEYVIAPYKSKFDDLPDISIYGMMPRDKIISWSPCIQKTLDEKYKLIFEFAEGVHTHWKFYKLKNVTTE
jgi:hypothetical protein